MSGFRRMKPVACAERNRNWQKPQNFRRAQRMFAEYLEHIRKKADSGAEKNQAGDIERVGAFAVVGEMQVDQDQADEANRNIHEEDKAPVEVSDDQAAGNGSEHGAD